MVASRRKPAKKADPKGISLGADVGVVSWVSRIVGDLVDFAETRNTREKLPDALWRAAFAGWMKETRRGNRA